MTNPHEHWQRVYRERAETSVSWYQAMPAKSLTYIREAAPHLGASIIDIGGGASTLADALMEEGYTDITVLDISEAALEHTKARLGSRAASIQWIAADITAWTPARTWDVWHDRAVFHFLTTSVTQAHYLDALRRGTRSGSRIIISTFALDGPERCSGLAVQRYSAQTLAQKLGTGFTLTAHSDEPHITPSGAVQKFAYAVFLRG